MKKLLFLMLLSGAVLTSCLNGGGKSSLKAENDSLKVELANRNSELDDIMGAFNEVQEGFRQINEAENRVDLQSGTLTERNSERIKEDIRFISEKLQENKEQISKLEKMLNDSKHASTQMKRAVANLTRELAEKQQQIETLQAELQSKNIRITELDDAVAGMKQDVDQLAADNQAKTQQMASQDKALNAAWFVFGTKSELKDQKILQNGDVLRNADFNKDYFTQIDIRTDKVIRLYSKRAELLTNHPAGSYEFVKDEKDQLSLQITNPSVFWSASRYLVILVR